MEKEKCAEFISTTRRFVPHENSKEILNLPTEEMKMRERMFRGISWKDQREMRNCFYSEEALQNTKIKSSVKLVARGSYFPPNECSSDSGIANECFRSDVTPNKCHRSGVAANEYPPSYAVAKECPPSDAIANECPSYTVVKECPPTYGIAKECRQSYAVAKECPTSYAVAKEFLSSDAIAKEYPPSDALEKECPSRRVSSSELNDHEENFIPPKSIHIWVDSKKEKEVRSWVKSYFDKQNLPLSSTLEGSDHNEDINVTKCGTIETQNTVQSSKVCVYKNENVQTEKNKISPLPTSTEYPTSDSTVTEYPSRDTAINDAFPNDIPFSKFNDHAEAENFFPPVSTQLLEYLKKTKYVQLWVENCLNQRNLLQSSTAVEKSEIYHDMNAIKFGNIEAHNHLIDSKLCVYKNENVQTEKNEIFALSKTKKSCFDEGTCEICHRANSECNYATKGNRNIGSMDTRDVKAERQLSPFQLNDVFRKGEGNFPADSGRIYEEHHKCHECTNHASRSKHSLIEESFESNLFKVRRSDLIKEERNSPTSVKASRYATEESTNSSNTESRSEIDREPTPPPSMCNYNFPNTFCHSCPADLSKMYLYEHRRNYEAFLCPEYMKRMSHHRFCLAEKIKKPQVLKIYSSDLCAEKKTSSKESMLRRSITSASTFAMYLKEAFCLNRKKHGMRHRYNRTLDRRFWRPGRSSVETVELFDMVEIDNPDLSVSESTSAKSSQ